MQFDHRHVIEQVPVDYYQQGVKNNILQRLWHTNKLRQVLQCIPSSPKKILDVGCASGWFLSRISAEYPNVTCYGIDIYKKSIEYGKKLYPNLKLQVADADKLPYKAKMFDIIICTEVLEHVDDPKHVLLEMRRVLADDGYVIVELDSGSILFSTVWCLWKKIRGKVWNDAHLHSFNVKKLARIAQDAGFAVIKKEMFNMRMAMVFILVKKI